MVGGDSSSLPFPFLVSVRWYLSNSRTAALFTILAIAISVAMATALEMSTRSVQSELELTADAIAGAAQLEVTGGSLGVSEALLVEITGVPGVTAASPLMEWTVRFREGPLANESLHVLGVDFLADRKVRDYSISDGALLVADPLKLLAEKEAIVVTQALMDRGGLEWGGVLPVRSDVGDSDLVVRGILLPGGVADAFGGQVAAMDVFALQAVMNRVGWFDRIDVVVDPSADFDRVRGELSRQLDGRATVRRARSRGEYAERAFGTVSLAVWLVAIIGVIVASFLSYSTMERTVDRRTSEFALLQSVGFEPSRVRRLIRVDALLLAAVGTALGLGAGSLLSTFFFSVFSRFSEHVQGIGVEDLTFSGLTLALGVFVGIGVSLTGSIRPSIRATSVPPLDVLRGTPPMAGRFGTDARRIAAGGLLAGAAAIVWIYPKILPPLIGLGSSYGLALTALITVGPAIIRSTIPRLVPLLDLTFPRVGTFAGASLLSRPLQAGLTITALASVVSGLVGIIIVLTSVGDTFHDWIGGRYPDGLIVSESDPFGALFDVHLSHDAVERIARTDGVADWLVSYNAWMMYEGQEVLVIARSMDAMARRGRVPAIHRPPKDVAHELGAGKVAVSEAFADRFGVYPGERIGLDTANGRQFFEVAALVRDYVGPSGSIHLDTAIFDRHWERDGAVAVVVWPKDPADDLTAAIRSRLSDQQTLFLTPAQDYADYTTRIFDQFQGVLYAVAGLASILGGVAVLNLMTGTIVERRRELALLRVAGATKWHLIGIVMLDALVVAGFGVVAGIFIGIAMSWPMLAVLHSAMGWTVERSIELVAVGGIGGLALLMALITAFYPAWMAVHVQPSEMHGFD